MRRAGAETRGEARPSAVARGGARRGRGVAAPGAVGRAYVPTRSSSRRRARAGRAPQRAAGVRARRRAVSRAIVRPGRRFNLVGLSWRGGRVSALSFRVRRDGGRWSRWVAVGGGGDDGPTGDAREFRRARARSDPLWAGRGRRASAHRRRRPRVRDLRLHFVNTKGTATALERLRTRLRHTVTGAVGAVASLGASARAVPTRRAGDRAARAMGRATRARRARARLRRGEARLHPSHGERERLRPRGLGRDGARHLPLPPQLQRLERHRLQLPRRPLRHDLRGPRRRHRRRP